MVGYGKGKRILITLPVTEQHRKLLEQAAGEAELIYTQDRTEIEEQLKLADGVIGNVPPVLLKQNKNLGWVQLNSAGTDGYTDEGVLSASAALTNATGAYGIAISEHMTGMLLNLLKKFPKYMENQKNRQWKDEGEVRPIWGCRILIIGMGDIGTEFARRMKAFGASIAGIRRTVHKKPDWVDELYTMDVLKEELKRADIVAVCLPGTESTRGLFGRELFQCMKQGAVFLNVGRGNIVDTDALADALEEGKLSGAGIDVADPEPLPSSSRLWNCPNVIITPHVSGGFHLSVTLDRIVEISAKNMRAFLGDGEYVSLVDRKTGYKKTETGE